MDRQYYVYILTNQICSVLYVGVTNDLVRRIYEHKRKIVDGFTKKYNIDKLVYYEEYSDIMEAIAREKQIKAGRRKMKIALIDTLNPEWEDLFDGL